jgi:hypothetical protein
MNELREGSRRSLRPTIREAGQARKHGMRLLEPHVRDLAAVAGVPPKRCPPEPPRIVDKEEHELEGVGEADEIELRCRRQRHGRVMGIERAAEARIGRALGRHEQMFPRPAEKWRNARAQPQERAAIVRLIRP